MIKNTPTATELRKSVIAKEGNVPGLKVRYISRPRAVTFPTGLKGYRGTVEISAPGHRTAVRNLLGDDKGWKF